MSKKWSFPSRSCILVEKRVRYMVVNERRSQEKSWSSEAHTFLSSHHPSLSCNSFLWKRIFFLGVLSSLVLLFLLLGAPPWPPPKCLLQMFICINVAYTRAGDRERGEPESFTKALWHSAPEIISSGGCPGQSALILRPSIPISKQNCNSYLQSEAPWRSEPKAFFPEKPVVASSIPFLHLTRMHSCLIQTNNQVPGPDGER